MSHAVRSGTMPETRCAGAVTLADLDIAERESLFRR